MTDYLTMKRRHEQEFNSFPMFFAFSNKQFEEGMKKLELSMDDTDKIYSIGAGGFIRKTDSNKLRELFERHEEERQEAIDNDVTGDGFVFQMFSYELDNHEYVVTYSPEDTLQALGLSEDEVNADEKLRYGLNKAIKEQLKRE